MRTVTLIACFLLMFASGYFQGYRAGSSGAFHDGVRAAIAEMKRQIEQR